VLVSPLEFLAEGLHVAFGAEIREEDGDPGVCIRAMRRSIVAQCLTFCEIALAQLAECD
jgi:hypothetical protein